MNPYGELSRGELEDQLVETEAEWRDCVHRHQELNQWGEVIQTHRIQILQAMGVIALDGREPRRPAGYMAEVVSIYE